MKGNGSLVEVDQVNRWLTMRKGSSLITRPDIHNKNKYEKILHFKKSLKLSLGVDSKPVILTSEKTGDIKVTHAALLV